MAITTAQKILVKIPNISINLKLIKNINDKAKITGAKVNIFYEKTNFYTVYFKKKYGVNY